MTLQRTNGLAIHAFPASQLGVYAPELHGSYTPNAVVPQRAQDALAATGALAVLDGPMFTVCGTRAGASGDEYERASCARPDFLLYDGTASAPVNLPSRRTSDGMTLSVLRGGTVAVSAGARPAPQALVAVQLYPELVRGGRNMANPARDTDRTQRAALGTLADGTLVFVVSDPMGMYEFARRLVAFGVKEAGYTDGGGSGRIATRAGEVAGNSKNRPVAAWLLDRGPSGTSAGAQSSAGAWIFGAALLATGLWVARNEGYL